MASLSSIRSALSSLADQPRSDQPFVAVFAGGTSGIGEATLASLVSHLGPVRPLHVYIVGRNAVRAASVISRCRDLLRTASAPTSTSTSTPALAPSTFTFLPQDLTLLSPIPSLVARIAAAGEPHLDLLFLTQGRQSVVADTTSEGVDADLALRYYSRASLALAALPLLRRARAPRVVSVLAPGSAGEAGGPLLLGDLSLRERKKTYGPAQNVRHASLMTTLLFERLAAADPSVSFLHVYPGPVRTRYLADGAYPPWLRLLVRWVLAPLMGVFAQPPADAGDRMLFLSLSARFPCSRDGEGAAAAEVGGPLAPPPLLPLPAGLGVAEGSTGELGSGAYCVERDGATCDNRVRLAGLRAVDAPELIWKHTMEVLEHVKAPGTA